MTDKRFGLLIQFKNEKQKIDVQKLFRKIGSLTLKNNREILESALADYLKSKERSKVE